MKKKWNYVFVIVCMATILVIMSRTAVLADEILEESSFSSEVEYPELISVEEDSPAEEVLSSEENTLNQVSDAENIVGRSLSAGEGVEATFDTDTGTVCFYSDGGELASNWILRTGISKYRIKHIRVESGTVFLPADSKELFSDISSLISFNASGFDTSMVMDMSRMFKDCSSLTTLDLSGFDTAKVTNMSQMFSYCYSLSSLDISNFDTSNVTDMSNMFLSCWCINELDVSSFETSNVTDMSGMFEGLSELDSLDLGNFETPKVKNMRYMFSGCKQLQDLNISTLFDTTKVNDMSYMFHRCSSLKNPLFLADLKTENVTNMSSMFQECENVIKLDLSNFDTSNVTNMSHMFYKCSSMTHLDLRGFDMTNVKTYDDMLFCPKLVVLYTPKVNSLSIDLRRTFYDEKEKAYINLPVLSESILLTRNYFSIERNDHNSYENNVKSFYSDSEIQKKQTTYRISNEKYKNRLFDEANLIDKRILIDKLNSAFTGACFGANVSMVLENLGIIHLSNGSYNSLGAPRDNLTLRDIIYYYQLYRYRIGFSHDYLTCSSFSFDKSHLIESPVSEKTFLLKLASEASKSEISRKPFIFNYEYKASNGERDGHSVIVCGFDREDYDNDGTDEYKIKIYDLNRHGTEYDYIYMYIEDDCSDFHFKDINNIREAENKGVSLEETWISMSFIGIETLENESCYKIEGEGSNPTSTDGNKINDYATIILDAGKPFVLTNDQGKTLSFDGSYSGDLDIYSIDVIEDDTPSLKLQVSPSNSFKVGGIHGDFNISTEINGHYYRTATHGADEILFSKDEGIILDGDGTYAFETALDADITNYSLIEISSTTNGKVSIINSDSSITLDSESPCTNLAVTYMNENGSVEEELEGARDHLSIFEDDGEFVYGNRINIAKATVTGVEPTYPYIGKDIIPYINVMFDGKMLTKGTDYFVEYLNNVDVGTATIKITGTGIYEGIKIVKFIIEKKAAEGFSDVQDPKHAYYKAIYWAADAGITKGYPDGTFGIGRSCTRGEMMMFLWRYAGKPSPKNVSKSPFKDVPKTHTFYKAILWGSQKGITKGYSDGTFGIQRNVSRGECMMFLWRLKGKPAPKAVAKSPFKDVPKTHAFYNAILWGAQKKITTGYTSGAKKGTFGINENCTRGQIVTFLYRAKQ